VFKCVSYAKINFNGYKKYLKLLAILQINKKEENRIFNHLFPFLELFDSVKNS